MTQMNEALGRKCLHLTSPLIAWIQAALDWIEPRIRDNSNNCNDIKLGIEEQCLKYVDHDNWCFATNPESFDENFENVRTRLLRIELEIKTNRGIRKRMNRISKLRNIRETVDSMSLFEIHKHAEWLTLDLIPTYISEADEEERALYSECKCLLEACRNTREQHNLMADLHSIRHLDTQGIPINIFSAHCLYALCFRRMNLLPGYLDFKAFMSCMRQGELMVEPLNTKPWFYDLYFMSSTSAEQFDSLSFPNEKELRAQACEQLDHVKTILNALDPDTGGHNSCATHTSLLLSRSTLREHLDMLSGLCSGLAASFGDSVQATVLAIRSVQQRLFDLLPRATDTSDHNVPPNAENARRYALPHGATTTTASSQRAVSSAEQQQQQKNNRADHQTKGENEGNYDDQDEDDYLLNNNSDDADCSSDFWDNDDDCSDGNHSDNNDDDDDDDDDQQYNSNAEDAG
eukprot:TRINITY_DN6221_c1_g2_i1.p1 TRINITY_DN6221_c1_g2~~TRINITY_DN6221_c1_g2_i1.p1  ORF type:complete len:460 (+),score=88.63 TRINITY_DN6221_c1_g2_i1:1008-2387(+)